MISVIHKNCFEFILMTSGWAFQAMYVKYYKFNPSPDFFFSNFTCFSRSDMLNDHGYLRLETSRGLCSCKQRCFLSEVSENSRKNAVKNECSSRSEPKILEASIVPIYSANIGQEKKKLAISQASESSINTTAK